MPINSSWWRLTKALVDTERDDGGAYELGQETDRTGQTAVAVIYIGSSGTVKSRLERHIDTDDPCLKDATHYRVEYTADYKKREQELYDEHVRLYGRRPRCNDVRPPGR